MPKSPEEEFSARIVRALGDCPDGYLPLQSQVMALVESGETGKVFEVITAVKGLLKAKVHAKPKYFSLCLIRDILESRRPEVVDFFVKKFMDRLALIALFEAPAP